MDQNDHDSLMEQNPQPTIKGEMEEETGPYSGLTKSELISSGTCEPDWY